MSDSPPPLVSTLIPTYRRPRLLRRAILSALAQAGPSLQVCVYDNASGDETAAVVTELAARDPRVRYHCHDRNIGGFDNFQFALSHVQTPFFSILSDDDVLLPGFLEQAMRGFTEHPQAKFWAGLTVRMTEDGTVYDANAEHWPREGLFAPPEGLLQLVRNKAPTWTAMLFRREVVDEIGLLDAEVNAPSDLDFMLRIAARFPYILSKQPAAIFLLNPQSFSENGPLSSIWPGWLKMIANVVATETLDEAAREEVAAALNATARRMLLRRSANALAKKNYTFARQAAEALQQHYGQTPRSLLLRSLATLCSSVPPAQRLYTLAYRLAEGELLRRRAELQQRYGDFARHLTVPAG